MKAGETQRFDCEGCSREFEVTYEPKAKGNPKEAASLPRATVKSCPFCGEDIVPSDE